MTVPRVSIGLPVFNGEDFLDEALTSLRAQSFEDLEIAISDNGSTDRTPDICRSHADADERIGYERSPVNRGSSWNYTRVFERSRGEYFKWAAHDDVLLPTYLEQCIDVLDADPGVVLCHTGVVKIDADGHPVVTYPPNPNASAGTPTRRFRDVLFREGPCYPVFGVVRREVLARTGLLGPYNGHDRPLLAELALHGRYAQVPERLFLNRDHPARSGRAYTGARARITWFDTSQAGRVVYRHPRLLAEYLKAIRRTDVGTRDRAGAFLAVIEWSLRHAPAFARDIAGGLREHAARLAGARRAAPGEPR